MEAIKNLTDRDNATYKLFEAGQLSYNQYLKTDHWFTTKKEAVLRCGGRCQLCNSCKLPLNTHHRTYNNLWQEKDCDLIVLCRDCHSLHHCKIDDVQMSFFVEYLGLPLDGYKQYRQRMAKEIANSLGKQFNVIIEKKLIYKIFEEDFNNVCNNVEGLPDTPFFEEEPLKFPKRMEEYDFVQENNIFPGITARGFIVSSLNFLKDWLEDEYEYKRLIKIFRGLDKAGEFPKN